MDGFIAFFILFSLFCDRFITSQLSMRSKKPNIFWNYITFSLSMRSKKTNFLDRFITLRSIHRSKIHIQIIQQRKFVTDS